MSKNLWNKDFILMLQANAVSALGDLMYGVAIGYWVYEKTGSNSLMGIMSSISLFVMMFLAPFTGSIVDKLNRKMVIVGVDIIQGVLMLSVGILAFTDRLNVPGVLFTAFVAALGSVFYRPATKTLMIDIIPRDHMVRGQSIHSGAISLVDIGGTAFSGAMVAFFGVPLIVILNGLSNLYSAATELFIKVPRTVQQGQSVTVKGILHDTGSAVGTIVKDKFLSLFIPSAIILNLLSSGSGALFLPFCLEKSFTVEQYGYLMSIFTIAQLVGVGLLGALKLSAKHRYSVMAIGFICSVPLYVAAYLCSSYVLTCVLAFAGAFMNCLGNAVFNAILMLALPQENRGSILGFFQSACAGGTALSAVIYGFLGDLFPLRAVFAVGTALSLLPMIMLCVNPRTKEAVMEH